MNTAWNTKQTSLGFLNGANSIHQLYLTDVDYGATMSAYTDNFSWGTLDLTGEDLKLQDGNTLPGGALYLREITGLELSGNLISNIFGMDGLDIYYMANLPENSYLDGLKYDLCGGGDLIPIGGTSVPEPATLLLVGSGSVGLVGCRRKFGGGNV